MTQIFQLRISLNGVRPEIWRRFLVEDNISFEKLHNIIQIVMGWENYHLYEFKIGNESIIPEEEGYNLAEGSFKKLFSSPEFIKMLEQKDLSKGSASLDINKMNKILKNIEKNETKKQYGVTAKINLLIKSENQKFTYIYDFGDCWEHTVVVEKILDRDDSKKYPICMDGGRNCPPEDCGGVYGYDELMKIRKNKNHHYYKERIVDWLGEDYDPELFVVDWVNAELHGKKPKPVWMMKR